MNVSILVEELIKISITNEKRFGQLLTPAILKKVDDDLVNTVFSYIPNTAIDAYHGLTEGLHEFCNKIKSEKVLALGSDIDPVKLREILSIMPRMEKVAVKDIKLRTFITEDNKRDDLVAHVYDVTYGVIKRDTDSLVVLDDSIVRGIPHLKQSILRILDRLGPKHIVITSSAPTDKISRLLRN